MYPNKRNKHENISIAFFKNYVYNALQYTTVSAIVVLLVVLAKVNLSQTADLMEKSGTL